MGKRKQHPLIVAIDKFDALLTGLDPNNTEAFTAYVRNKVAIQRSKSSSSKSPNPAPRAAGKSSSKKSEKKDTSTLSSPMTEAGALSVAAGSSGGEG